MDQSTALQMEQVYLQQLFGKNQTILNLLAEVDQLKREVERLRSDGESKENII